jgi:hypothetical protein
MSDAYTITPWHSDEIEARADDIVYAIRDRGDSNRHWCMAHSEAVALVAAAIREERIEPSALPADPASSEGADAIDTAATLEHAVQGAEYLSAKLAARNAEIVTPGNALWELGQARAEIATLRAALEKIANGQEVQCDGHTEFAEVEDASEIARAALAAIKQ